MNVSFESNRGSTRCLLAGISALVLALVAAPAVAQRQAMAGQAMSSASIPPLPTEHVQNGIRYIAGGIGIDVRQRMQAATGYNLRLSFAAARDNHYIPDVRVSIRDANGRRVLEVPAAGPLFFAELPHGTYEVTATHRRVTETRTLDIDKGLARAYFHWKGTTPLMG
jgi:hypothetical protein